MGVSDYIGIVVVIIVAIIIFIIIVLFYNPNPTSTSGDLKSYNDRKSANHRLITKRSNQQTTNRKIAKNGVSGAPMNIPLQAFMFFVPANQNSPPRQFTSPNHDGTSYVTEVGVVNTGSSSIRKIGILFRVYYSNSVTTCEDYSNNDGTLTVPEGYNVLTVEEYLVGLDSRGFKQEGIEFNSPTDTGFVYSRNKPLKAGTELNLEFGIDTTYIQILYPGSRIIITGEIIGPEDIIMDINTVDTKCIPPSIIITV